MTKEYNLERDLDRISLINGCCPYCRDNDSTQLRLVGQQELDGQHYDGSIYYVRYWSCPMCERTEDELASSLGMKYKMCKTCHGFGTIKWYEESDDECDHCDGVGYLLEVAE